MKPRDRVELCWTALREHRLRTLLALLGIAIAVAAVVLLVSVGEGARAHVLGAFAQFGTNLLQVPILGTAFIAGHVFLDLDTSATDNGEPDAVGVTVVITDLTSGNTFNVLTDASGNYVAAVPPGAQVQAVVQNGTGTIPAGSALTTGNASQTRTAGAAGTTVNNTDVGYDPPPLSITPAVRAATKPPTKSAMSGAMRLQMPVPMPAERALPGLLGSIEDSPSARPSE